MTNDIKSKSICDKCKAAKCYVSCPTYLTHFAGETEFWGWWRRSTPPDFRDSDPLPQGEPSGKSSSGSKKKHKDKKPERATSWYYYGDV